MTERAERIQRRLIERGLYGYLRKAVQDHHAVEANVLGTERRHSSVRARHALWLAVHDDAGLSWPEIAEIFETTHDRIIHASSRKESRAREGVERPLIERIAAFVRRTGYGVLAREIEAGAWRDQGAKCPVPSCPRRARNGKACSAHPEVAAAAE